MYIYNIYYIYIYIYIHIYIYIYNILEVHCSYIEIYEVVQLLQEIPKSPKISQTFFFDIFEIYFNVFGFQ